MYWKTIKDIKITDLRKCLFRLKKKYIVSPWIEDIINKNKNKKYKKNKVVHLYRISVKSLGFKKPTKLKKIYSKLKSKGLKLLGSSSTDQRSESTANTQHMQDFCLTAIKSISKHVHFAAH